MIPQSGYTLFRHPQFSGCKSFIIPYTHVLFSDIVTCYITTYYLQLDVIKITGGGGETELIQQRFSLNFLLMNCNVTAKVNSSLYFSAKIVYIFF